MKKKKKKSKKVKKLVGPSEPTRLDRINAIEWEIGCDRCKTGGFLLVGYWYEPDSPKNDYVVS